LEIKRDELRNQLQKQADKPRAARLDVDPFARVGLFAQASAIGGMDAQQEVARNTSIANELLRQLIARQDAMPIPKFQVEALAA